MATIRLVPSTYAVSNTSYVTASNTSNMYTNTDSTTSGTFTHNRASTNSIYYAYLRGFNFSDIPSNAIINSFEIKLKASATGHTTSTSSSYYMSLVNGTTQIASTTASGRLTTSTTVFTFANGSLDWNDVTGYESSFGIRIPLRRASSNTADVVTVYGAEIEVDYTIPDPVVITSTLTGDGTIDPSGTYNTYKDVEYTLTITPTDTSESVTVTNNGADVTSQLVAHGHEQEAEFTAEDVTTSGIQSGSSYAQYAVGHSAEDPYSSTSNMYASQNSTGYAEYSFDFSSIPSNATIEGIEVKAYGHRESSTISSTYVSQCVLYQGSSAISDEVDFPSTSNAMITITPTDIPTRSELDNVTLRHYVGYYGGLVLGITFTVTYSTGTGLDHYTYTFVTTGDATIAVVIGIQETSKLYLKINNVWTGVQTAYKKVNGVWVEQDITSLFNNAQNYRKGT